MLKLLLLTCLLSLPAYASEDPTKEDKDKTMLAKNTTTKAQHIHLRKQSNFQLIQMVDENKTDEYMDPFDNVTMLVQMVEQEAKDKQALVNKATYHQ